MTDFMKRLVGIAAVLAGVTLGGASACGQDLGRDVAQFQRDQWQAQRDAYQLQRDVALGNTWGVQRDLGNLQQDQWNLRQDRRNIGQDVQFASRPGYGGCQTPSYPQSFSYGRSSYGVGYAQVPTNLPW